MRQEAEQGDGSITKVDPIAQEFPSVTPRVPAAVWGAILLTIYSGWEYIMKAVNLLRRSM